MLRLGTFGHVVWLILELLRNQLLNLSIQLFLDQLTRLRGKELSLVLLVCENVVSLLEYLSPLHAV